MDLLATDLILLACALLLGLMVIGSLALEYLLALHVSPTPKEVVAMPKSIWKFPLQITDTQVVTVPKDSTPLSIQVHLGQLWLFVLVNPTSPEITAPVAIYQTNVTIPDEPGEFIGTFRGSDGDRVFHVFAPSGRKS